MPRGQTILPRFKQMLGMQGLAAAPKCLAVSEVDIDKPGLLLMSL